MDSAEEAVRVDEETNGCGRPVRKRKATSKMLSYVDAYPSEAYPSDDEEKPKGKKGGNRARKNTVNKGEDKIHNGIDEGVRIEEANGDAGPVKIDAASDEIEDSGSKPEGENGIRIRKKTVKGEVPVKPRLKVRRNTPDEKGRYYRPVSDFSVKFHFFC